MSHMVKHLQNHFVLVKSILSTPPRIIVSVAQHDERSAVSGEKNFEQNIWLLFFINLVFSI